MVTCPFIHIEYGVTSIIMVQKLLCLMAWCHGYLSLYCILEDTVTSLKARKPLVYWLNGMVNFPCIVFMRRQVKWQYRNKRISTEDINMWWKHISFNCLHLKTEIWIFLSFKYIKIVLQGPSFSLHSSNGLKIQQVTTVLIYF